MFDRVNQPYMNMNTDPKDGTTANVDATTGNPGGKGGTASDATSDGAAPAGSTRSGTGGLQVPIDNTRVEEKLKKEKEDEEELESDPATD